MYWCHLSASIVTVITITTVLSYCTLVQWNFKYFYNNLFRILRTEQKKIQKLFKEKETLNKELSTQTVRVRELERKEKELDHQLKSQQNQLQLLQKQLK